MSVVSTGELAVLARACVEDPRRDVPLVLQVGVGNRIFREMWPWRCPRHYLRDLAREELDKIERKWAEANWVCCTRCGRKLTSPQSVRRHMGSWCAHVVKAEAHREEMRQLREAE